MKQLVRFLNWFVFLASTAVLVGVYYEGMAREWFPIVGAFILAADISFFVSTLINLFYFRKEKALFEDRKLYIFENTLVQLKLLDYT
jgi:hypothetical protein